MLNQSEVKLKKNPLQPLAAAFGIQPGEGTPFLLLFGQSFFLGVTLITFYTAANTLFLLEFGASVMPYVYIVTAVATTLIGVAFTQLERRLSLPVVLVATMGFLWLSVLGLWVGLLFTSARWLVFFVMAWLRLLWVIANLELWVLTGRLFNVRQGKRLFPLIMAGPVLAIILIGFFTAALISRLGTVNLLLISTGGLTVAMALLLLTIAKFRQLLTGNKPADLSATNQPRSESQGVRALLQNRFIALFFIYTALSTAGTYVLDFAFVSEAEARFQDTATLGRFFGNFLAVSTFILLLLSLVSGRIFNRYGLKVGVILNPVLVGIGALAVIFSGSLLGLVGLVFWLTVLTKLTDDVMVVVNNAGRNLLYQPLRDEQRVPVQTAVESIIAPIFAGLTGMLLLLLGTLGNFNTMAVLLLFLVIVAGWWAVGVLLNREYGVALRQALTKRRLGSNTQPLVVDKAGAALLRQGLSSAQAGVAIYSLDMLAESEPESLPPLLPDLLHHTAPEVRQHALKRIEQMQCSATLPAVRQLVAGETEPAVRGSALRTLAALGKTDVIGEVSGYLNVADEPVKLGAMVGLLRHGGLEGTLLAGQKLMEMVDAPQPADRVLAARVLGKVGVYTLYQPLAQLLNDDEPDVQRAALIAAGQVRNDNLWPLVIARLESPPVRGAAVSALVAGGESALPDVGRAFAQPGQSPAMLAQLARVLGRIQGEQAVSSLQPKINFPDAAVRSFVLASLSRCGYRAQNGAVADTEQQINVEAAYAAWLLAALVDVNKADPPPAFTLLDAGLRHCLRQTQNRIFYLLSFLHDAPSMLRARDIFNSRQSSAKERAYALELVDIVISQTHKTIFFPLLQEMDAARQLKSMAAIYPQPALEPGERLRQLVTAQDDAWLKVCAMFAIGALPQPDLFETATAALDAANPLLRETALWALSRMQPVSSIEQSRLDTLQRDSSPQVARLATGLSNPDTGKSPMLSTIERVLFLKGIDLFAQLPGEALVEIAQMAREVSFLPDDVFINEGVLGDCLYVILDGEARVMVDAVGQVATLGAKDVIGEMAILADNLRSASAVAATELTALKIEREDFQALILEQPELSLGVIKVLVQRLDEASRRVTS